MSDADVMVSQSQTDLAQCHHDELGVLAAQSTKCGNTLSVERIEVLVDLIEVVEWTRFVVLDREDEAQCGHRLLAPREVGTASVPALPRRYAGHFETTFEGVPWVLQTKRPRPARLQNRVDALEVLVDVVEYCEQPRAAFILELLDNADEHLFAFPEDFSVGDEVCDSLDCSVVLLDGEHVDVAELAEAAVKDLHPFLRLGHCWQLSLW